MSLTTAIRRIQLGGTLVQSNWRLAKPPKPQGGQEIDRGTRAILTSGTGTGLPRAKSDPRCGQVVGWKFGMVPLSAIMGLEIPVSHDHGATTRESLIARPP